MDSSPKGRTIEELEGDGAAVSTRGHAIEKLGEQMLTSAVTLQSIADGASGQKGLAVDKLKDVVGDCYKELKLAGEHYKPNGKPLYTYGDVVTEVQPKIKSVVADCETAWHTYTEKSGSIPSAIPSGDEPSDQTAAKTAKDKAQTAHDDAAAAATTAYNTWKSDAETFDGYYDTWEDAFDKAVNEIQDATKGDIKDSFWDNVDGFVAAALKVLQVVGLVLGILALIIGGPIIGALAAIVAIATLVLTIYSFSRGNSSKLDLALAVVGVIPFGSAGKLFQSGKRLEFLHDAAGGLTSTAGRAAIRGNAGDFVNAAHGLATGFARGGGGLSGAARGLRGSYMALAGPNGAGAGNTIARIFTGQNMADATAVGRHPLSIVLGTFSSIYGNVIGIPKSLYGYAHSAVTGN